MTLTTSQILQIDAAVIAGVLLLLGVSVGHFEGEEFFKVKWLVTMTMSVVVPFSVSVFIISMRKYHHLKKNREITTKDITLKYLKVDGVDCGDLPTTKAPSVFAPEGIFKDLEGVREYANIDRKNSPSTLESERYHMYNNFRWHYMQPTIVYINENTTYVVEQYSVSSYIKHHNNCNCSNTCHHCSGSLVSITRNTTRSVNPTFLDSSLNLYYCDWPQ